jgi:hypothetical protein
VYEVQHRYSKDRAEPREPEEARGTAETGELPQTQAAAKVEEIQHCQAASKAREGPQAQTAAQVNIVEDRYREDTPETRKPNCCQATPELCELTQR